jgi:hypothetical protein
LAGYLLKRLSVPRAVYDAVSAWVAGLDKAEAQVLRHVVGSQLCQAYGEGWVPLGQAWVRQHFGRKLRLSRLVEAGWLEVQPHAVSQGLSRRFRVSGCWWEALLAGLPEGLAALQQAGLVDLFQGSAATVEQSGRYDMQRNKLPEATLRVLTSYRGTVVNHAAMQALQASRREAAGGQARYRQDQLCLLAVARQGFEATDDTFGVYVPAYEVATTGRLFQRGGGLQTASRAMKAAAYRGVPGVRNYDLRNAQLVCLRHELRLAEAQGLQVDTGWLEDYLAEPDGKRLCAAALGVSVGCWKDLLYSLLMGARVNGHSIRGILAAENLAGDDLEAVQQDFTAVTQPLRAVLHAWYRHLEGQLDSAVRTRQGRFVRNACQARYYFEADYARSRHGCLRRLACHRLQGLERAVIQGLELGADLAGFQLQGNEHDGLVTRGAIPQALFDRVVTALGIEGLTLEEKPLA